MEIHFSNKIATYLIISQLLILVVWCTGRTNADKPCAARTGGESVVCICNATYCDEVTRDPPAPCKYVAYTSSKGGSRFKKTCGELKSCDRFTSITDVDVLEINPDREYQKIEGFGGAATDSAGIQYNSLPDGLKNSFMQSYCGELGLEYNMIRVPIGGCDFSTRAYTYNETPENDTKLCNYSLAYEDIAYKIPLIKACMDVSTSPVHVVATTWSPPPWMKTNDKIDGMSFLIEDYYQTYADYHVKFIQKYKEKGIPVWAITTTNEPRNGLGVVVPFNDMGWTASKMGRWIKHNLGPTIRRDCEEVKILAHDDQRSTIKYFFNLMLAEHPDVSKYIDGVAVHWYEDKVIPPDVLADVARDYPDKIILATEACSGALPTDSPKVDLGSWSRAKDYITDILQDLNYYVSGWIDWNMCLDEQGGPNWAQNYVDSPVIVYPDKGEFLKQPMFYAMGHFSKFLPRGSVRIEVNANPAQLVQNVAVKTPDGNIVVVLYNDSVEKTTVKLKIGAKQAVVGLEADSVTTIEIAKNCDDGCKSQETPTKDKEDQTYFSTFSKSFSKQTSL